MNIRLLLKNISHFICFILHTALQKVAEKKQKNLVNYGWKNNDIDNSDAKNQLKEFLDIKKSPFYYKKSIESLSTICKQNGLNYSNLDRNFNHEKGVMKLYQDNNYYFSLFRHIRNCLAHGCYKLVYNKDNVKMFIMEDKKGKEITARFVFKLSTLLNFVHIIDKNNTLKSRLYDENTGKEG